MWFPWTTSFLNAPCVGILYPLQKSGRQLDDGDTLTGVAITPGTTFMLDLTHSLTYYVCVKLSGKRYRHLKFEISDGTVMVSATPTPYVLGPEEFLKCRVGVAHTGYSVPCVREAGAVS